MTRFPYSRKKSIIKMSNSRAQFFLMLHSFSHGIYLIMINRFIVHYLNLLFFAFHRLSFLRKAKRFIVLIVICIHVYFDIITIFSIIILANFRCINVKLVLVTHSSYDEIGQLINSWSNNKLIMIVIYAICVRKNR